MRAVSFIDNVALAMGSFQDMCNAGAEIAITSDLIGEAFTLRGVQYTGVVDSNPESEMFAGGGSIESRPISIVMKLEDAPDTDIHKGDIVTYGGQTYTIRQVDSDGISFITLIGEAGGHRK